MLTEERQHLILQLLNERRAVTVIELTQALGASEATIRRDLNALHELGRLNKVHGGATALNGAFSASEADMSTKLALHMPEKDAIAAYAATLIEDDDFVYLDAGTTTERMIEHLSHTKAGFVTNGIEHARLLTRKGCKTFMLGGQFKPSTEAIVGAMAVDSIRRYNFTKCFMGTNGVSVDCGFTTPDAEEAALKTEAMNHAYLSFMLADHSKFGLVTSVTFAPLRKACILTERDPGEAFTGQTIIKVVPKGVEPE